MTDLKKGTKPIYFGLAPPSDSKDAYGRRGFCDGHTDNEGEPRALSVPTLAVSRVNKGKEKMKATGIDSASTSPVSAPRQTRSRVALAKKMVVLSEDDEPLVNNIKRKARENKTSSSTSASLSGMYEDDEELSTAPLMPAIAVAPPMPASKTAIQSLPSPAAVQTVSATQKVPTTEKAPTPNLSGPEDLEPLAAVPNASANRGVPVPDMSVPAGRVQPVPGREISGAATTKARIPADVPYPSAAAAQFINFTKPSVHGDVSPNLAVASAKLKASMEPGTVRNAQPVQPTKAPPSSPVILQHIAVPAPLVTIVIPPAPVDPPVPVILVADDHSKSTQAMNRVAVAAPEGITPPGTSFKKVRIDNGSGTSQSTSDNELTTLSSEMALPTAMPTISGRPSQPHSTVSVSPAPSVDAPMSNTQHIKSEAHGWAISPGGPSFYQ